VAVKQQVIPIAGGINLTAGALDAPQGSAQACLNYEVGIRDGIRRIDGWSRWDGRPNAAGVTSALQLYYKSASASTFTLGETVSIKLTTSSAITYFGVVVSVVSSSGLFEEHTVKIGFLTAPVSLPRLDEVTGLASGEQWTTLLMDAAATYADGPVTYSAYSDLVTQLPGDSFTRVPGIEFFNDKVYAVVDLVSINVSLDSGIVPLEGLPIYANDGGTVLGTLYGSREAETPNDIVLDLFDYDRDADLPADTGIFAPVASQNMVTNCHFDTALLPQWTAGTAGSPGWALGSRLAVHVPTGGTNTLTHLLPAVVGRTYEIEYRITVRAGGIAVSFGGGADASRTATGTYTLTVTASSTAALVATANATFDGDLHYIAVREVVADLVTNGDMSSGTGWTAGAGWVISGGVATATASSSTLVNSMAPVSGLQYRVQYTVTRSAGTVTVSLGGASGAARSAAGTYSDIINAASAAQLTFTGAGFTGTLDNVSVEVVHFIGDCTAHVEPKRAAIYCAEWDGAGGWSRIDAGRVMGYAEDGASSLTAFFLPYVRRAFTSQATTADSDTGWIGADGWEDIGGGNRGWTGDPAGLATDDGTTVSSAGSSINGDTTTVLKATFSTAALQIPGGAIVKKILVRVRGNCGTSAGAFDMQVRIGTTTTPTRANLARSVAAAWTTTEGAVEYGSTDPLWTGNSGDAQITPDEINDGGLNVQLQFRLQQAAASNNMVLDEVAVKVYYQDQTTAVLVTPDTGAGPEETEIEVIHYTVAEGASGGGTGGVGNRIGMVVFNSSVGTAADRWWSFGPGQPMKTIGGTILAYVGSSDVPLTLPSSYAVADEDARYQFHSANPYASDLYDVLFIASGAEHAYMFDGDYLLPIQTGLLDQFEKPRHVAWAGNYLALGYRTGSVSISDVGDPLTYVSAASTAAEIGASDRITGLLRLKGDALGVFTEGSIFALQGVTDTITRVEISPNSGAIEYSVQDAGRPVFLDYLGPATVDTTDQYGDFDSTRMAGGATPWFVERLQLPTRNQTTDRTFIASYLMRSKGQVRYLFKDGWQATLTLSDKGVQTTTQRFYGDFEDRDGTAITVLGLCHGTTSTGQDVAFMTFDRDPTGSRYRYVFQLDNGNSFDGEEIIAQWVSQPLHLGSIFTRKSGHQLGLYGRAFGYARMKVYIATELETPTSDETTGASATGTFFDFGTSGTVDSEERNYRDIHALRWEGEDVTVLIESISATALPHTIQSMVWRFEQENPKP